MLPTWKFSLARAQDVKGDKFMVCVQKTLFCTRDDKRGSSTNALSLAI